MFLLKVEDLEEMAVNASVIEFTHIDSLTSSEIKKPFDVLLEDYLISNTITSLHAGVQHERQYYYIMDMLNNKFIDSVRVSRSFREVDGLIKVFQTVTIWFNGDTSYQEFHDELGAVTNEQFKILNNVFTTCQAYEL